ncbi:ovocalyxin-32-like isoform X1 [Notechis scutatus]|uniref:Ovocalyxin-32-like isoform X1 n=1 Tax=Notechis scutatus TaxID=8663 RepID=A0A6J1TSQ6_9SAUR|nr:ovocalyxin-32-like isoform X1 [Notechis scutatus]
MPRMAAVVLLLLLPALCSAWPSIGRYPEYLRPLSRGNFHASDSQFLRVARAAVNYLNYGQGSPSLLRKVALLGKTSVRNIPGVGHEYSLQFYTKHIQTGQYLGKCNAKVRYQKKMSKPLIDISCTDNKDADQIMKDDYSLYTKLKATSSPDELKYFANVGSSYIAWKESSEYDGYVTREIKDAKRWVRDNALEFDYTILVDSDVSKNFSCHMRITWNLELPIKVKYTCFSEDTSAESADGSGEESGSYDSFQTNF